MCSIREIRAKIIDREGRTVPIRIRVKVIQSNSKQSVSMTTCFNKKHFIAVRVCLVSSVLKDSTGENLVVATNAKEQLKI